MTEPRKVAISLLCTILLFTGFMVASFIGLFDLIEARFYNPSVTAALSGDLGHEAASIEVFITTVERWFSDTLAEPAVKRSFMVNQADADIYERSEVFALLHEKLDGLQWVRFIDAGGNRIHYSTWQGDLIREDSATAVYRMYTEAAFYTPLENLLPLPAEDFRIVFDPPGGRIVFSLPFYDALDAYRGLAVFSLSVSAIQNRLVADRRGGQGKIWLIAEPLGLLRGVPEDNMTEVFDAVAENWRQSGVTKKVSVSIVESGGNRSRLVLLSAKTLQGFYIGNLVNEYFFVFPPSLKALLLILFFITVFLVFFLLINVRQDPMTIVQSRLKNLQIGLIKEYYNQKTDIELSRWGMELMQRREEIREELRHGLTMKSGKKLDKDINAYIDKSWNDLLAVIGGRLERTVNEEEIHLTLNRLTDTLSSLVEGGTFVPAGTTETLSIEKPVPGKPDLKAVSAMSTSLDEIEPLEEMVPFAEDAEGFPAAEESASLALDESEEMAPFFMGEIEEFQEDAPPKSAPKKNKNTAAGDAKSSLVKQPPLFDYDETDGMIPFIMDTKNAQPTKREKSIPDHKKSIEKHKSAQQAQSIWDTTGGTTPIVPPAQQSAASAPEEIEELDVLETVEDVEKIKTLEGTKAGKKSDGAEGSVTPDSHHSRFDGIAREVEWSKTSDETEEPLALELEVSSPFSSSGSGKKSEFVEQNVFDDDVPLKNASTPDAAPILYTSFLPPFPPATSGNGSMGLARKASVINEARKMSTDSVDDQIIREQNGIAYIQETALHPTADEEEDLDPRMKGLVNSVLKQTE